MQPKQYTNNIYGDYITYDVNNVYEAIHVLKHSSRIKQYASINEDPLSRKFISIYKEELKKTNDLNDLFLKYKIQFIHNFNETISEKRNLYPNFYYITFQNDRWFPIKFIDIFSNVSIQQPINKHESNILQSDVENTYINLQNDENNLDDELESNDIENNKTKECNNRNSNNVKNKRIKPLIKNIRNTNVELKKRLLKSYLIQHPKMGEKFLNYCL